MLAAEGSARFRLTWATGYDAMAYSAGAVVGARGTSAETGLRTSHDQPKPNPTFGSRSGRGRGSRRAFRSGAFHLAGGAEPNHVPGHGHFRHNVRRDDEHNVGRGY